jgi:hypothetical protein
MNKCCLHIAALVSDGDVRGVGCVKDTGGDGDVRGVGLLGILEVMVTSQV